MRSISISGGVLISIISCLSFPIMSFAQATAGPNVDHIDEYLLKSQKRGFSGAVLIAKDNKVLLSGGYGKTSIDSGNKITPATVFNIGSVTKQFTAAGIMKLVEEGKLEVSDNLGRFFPDIPEDKKNITIHQLLTHTSGLSGQAEGFRYDYIDRGSFLDRLFETPLVRKPGVRYEYSNVGYIVLAAIMEIVSGRKYEEYLNKSFFVPLQMYRTGYLLPEWDTDNMAHGSHFDIEKEEWVDWGITLDRFKNAVVSWNSMGKGDIQSSVTDLYIWHKALQEGSVLSPSSVEKIQTGYVPEQESGKSYYGYGWAIFTSQWGSKIVTHNGSNGMYFADFIRYVDDGVVVIMLTNINGARDISGLAHNLARMVFDPEFIPPLFPEDPYELVVNFINSHKPAEADSLLMHYREVQGTGLDEKAVLNSIGIQQLNRKRYEWSVALFNLNVRIFPEDGNLWDSLGEGYFASGDEGSAIKSFQEALRLDPGENCYWCENSAGRLRELLRGTD